MSTQVIPPQYVFGTHSLAILSDPVVHGQQVFSTSVAIAIGGSPATQSFVPRAPAYLTGTHTLALLQEHAGRSSRVFSPVAPSFPGFAVARDFIICEAEQPWPSPSWILNTSALIAQGAVLGIPIIGILVSPPQYPLDLPYSDIYSPAPPPFVAPITNFLVQATAIGWSMGFDPVANAPTGELILRAPGDVFYIQAADFADSSIDYLAGQPGSPFFGWMRIVPPGTPLTNPTHLGFPFYDYQPPPRRTIF